MSAIKATWNGGGLPDGTDITSANAATPGNSFGAGINWTFAGTTPVGDRQMVTAGDGVRVLAAGTGGMAMLRANFATPTTAARGQVIATMSDQIVGPNVGIIQANEGETNRGWVRMRSDGRMEMYVSQDIAASRTPAIAVGAKLLVDVVYHAGASAGRMFYRVTNLSDTSWNGVGYFFHDTGYTLPLPAQYTRIQFGKATSGATVAEPGILLERMGAEAISVSTSATSEAAASAYFADTPGDPLPTPEVTVTASVNPTSPAATNGSITATWLPIAGASRYEAGIADGDVDDGFDIVATNATSPYTWGGLAGGVHTVAIRAVP